MATDALRDCVPGVDAVLSLLPTMDATMGLGFSIDTDTLAAGREARLEVAVDDTEFDRDGDDSASLKLTERVEEALKSCIDTFGVTDILLVRNCVFSVYI